MAIGAGLREAEAAFLESRLNALGHLALIHSVACRQPDLAFTAHGFGHPPQGRRRPPDCKRALMEAKTRMMTQHPARSRTKPQTIRGFAFSGSREWQQRQSRFENLTLEGLTPPGACSSSRQLLGDISCMPSRVFV